MSTWKISKINNKIGRIVMINENKETLDISMPAQHRTHDAKKAHIKNCTDAYDNRVKEAAAVVVQIKTDKLDKAVIDIKHISIALAIQSAFIIGLIFLVCRR